MFSVQVAPSVAYFNSVQEICRFSTGYKNLNFGISAGARANVFGCTFSDNWNMINYLLNRI